MTLRKEKVFFFKNTKQTGQDNPCLWFPPFFFTSLSTRTWPLHKLIPSFTLTKLLTLKLIVRGLVNCYKKFYKYCNVSGFGSR